MIENKNTISLSDGRFDRVERDAVKWFTRINHGEPNRKVRGDFYRWLEAKPEHWAKYEAVKELMEQTREFTDDPALKAYYQSLITEKESWVTKLTFLFGGGLKMAIVAACLLIIASPFAFLEIGAPQIETYSTAIGETRSITLADRSVINMNTNTVLTVHYTDDRRSVTLQQGQANFDVAKGPDRPFSVSTDFGSVTVLGTEFDIRAAQETVHVNLIEGKIRVDQGKSEPVAKDQDVMNNPQAIIIEADGLATSYIALSSQGVSQVEHKNPNHVSAWEDGKIVFDEKSLATVIEELNRYSTKRIVLNAPYKKDELITAIVPTDVSEALVLIKKHFQLIEVKDEEEQIILVPTAEKSIAA